MAAWYSKSAKKIHPQYRLLVLEPNCLQQQL